MKKRVLGCLLALAFAAFAIPATHIQFRGTQARPMVADAQLPPFPIADAQLPPFPIADAQLPPFPIANLAVPPGTLA
jgi:hypothetical protein